MEAAWATGRADNLDALQAADTRAASLAASVLAETEKIARQSSPANGYTVRKTLTSEALKKAQRKYKTSEKGREMARRWRSTPEQRAKTAAQVARLRAARRAAGLTNEGKPRQRARLDGMSAEEKRARKTEQQRTRRAAKKGAK